MNACNTLLLDQVYSVCEINSELYIVISTLYNIFQQTIFKS